MTSFLLSAIIFVPTIGALFLLAFPKKSDESMRMFSLGVTVVTFFLTLMLLGEFNPSDGGIQPVNEDGTRGIAAIWISNWNIYYRIGFDGISLPLVLLTSFICVKKNVTTVTARQGCSH